MSWVKKLALAWVTLSVVSIWLQYTLANPVAGVILAIAGGIGYIGYRFIQSDYTGVDTA